MTRKMKKVLYIEEAQNKAQVELSKETRIPQAALVREGIDAVINKFHPKPKRKKKR